MSGASFDGVQKESLLIETSPLTRAAIEHSIKADHGYNLDSRSVRSLIDVMAGYSKEERRQFLQL